MPMSERKTTSTTDKCEPFHMVHKVPAGDSPYVRAKHVQLISKDPGRAISLFWAAINAGDRVDSALKDMAVVMKQLNRSDEGIEAIKSFRCLCPDESQDSIDNLLLELYKKSGRIEEEAELLETKLRNLEDGMTFGGTITKTKRSQGKQVTVTIEQERARLLGNLAWVHLQLHNYGIAEHHYRRALSLEPDKNKMCNLAICLMRMDRLPEARSMLQEVRDCLGSQWRDEPFSKSFERAIEMLEETESRNENDDARADIAEDNALDGCSQSSCSDAFKNSNVSPSGLFTQPRGCYEEGDRRKRTCREMGGSVRRLLLENPLCTEQQNLEREEPVASSKEETLGGKRLDHSLIHGLHEFITETEDHGMMGEAKKSWADIVEEEEEEIEWQCRA
ncbi:PREDICTED: protein POLLENLESS 3 [Tarenaya hassleriana]|uniref:protein POLLENLESS 3 n=1 Tax=Tarenaya hassleriana TaxID=28532 RepID=UPI00053C86B5|nr:PREDICTED: protein POLLENLESS 3 [Tarenaya hassleriana]